MSKTTFVDYLIYKGEKKTGMIVIKTEKGNSKFRTFTYVKGVKYRVGVNVTEKQALFLRRNHSDLFVMEKIEVQGMDLILKDLEEIVPRFHSELDKSADTTLRYINEASMVLLGIFHGNEDSDAFLQRLLHCISNGYREEIGNVRTKEIFTGIASEIPDKIEQEISKAKPVQELNTEPRTLLKRRNK